LLGKKGLSLGTMAFVLRKGLEGLPILSGHSAETLSGFFCGWVKKHKPSFLGKLDTLDRIVRLRNPAAHDSLPEAQALTIPSLCRGVLETLV
jgi:hypothetical protein